MGNLIKQQYVSCELKIVEFNVERGFAASPATPTDAMGIDFTSRMLRQAKIDGDVQATQMTTGNIWYQDPNQPTH